MAALLKPPHAAAVTRTINEMVVHDPPRQITNQRVVNRGQLVHMLSTVLPEIVCRGEKEPVQLEEDDKYHHHNDQNGDVARGFDPTFETTKRMGTSEKHRS